MLFEIHEHVHYSRNIQEIIFTIYHYTIETNVPYQVNDNNRL